MARSSRSKALYRVCAGLRALEKYARGRHWLAIRCCSTAPTAVSEASVMMQVGAPSSGCTNRVALAIASLTLAKASVAASLQGRVLVCLLVPTKSAFSGCGRAAQCGMKRR